MVHILITLSSYLRTIAKVLRQEVFPTPVMAARARWRGRETKIDVTTESEPELTTIES